MSKQTDICLSSIKLILCVFLINLIAYLSFHCLSKSDFLKRSKINRVMEIRDRNKKRITSIQEWEDHFRSKSDKWKEGRSAHTLAKFVLDKEGDRHIQEHVSKVLAENVRLEVAEPEYEVRFDKYKGKGRNHDLAIFAKTESGKRIFIGLEAKVDEPFGEPISKEYDDGLKKQKNEATNVPERIRGLLKLYFPQEDIKSLEEREILDAPYQLLHGTAGTVAVDADIWILYVIVFQTQEYTDKDGERNDKEYLGFMKKFEGKKIENEHNMLVHELMVKDKRLICIYEKISAKAW